jgi:hypothetical protein
MLLYEKKVYEIKVYFPGGTATVKKDLEYSHYSDWIEPVDWSIDITSNLCPIEESCFKDWIIDYFEENDELIEQDEVVEFNQNEFNEMLKEIREDE